MNFYTAILWNVEHFQYGGFKWWRKVTIGCLTCCGPKKRISRFESLWTATSANFGLLKIPEFCVNSIAARKSHAVGWIYHIYCYRARFLPENAWFWFSWELLALRMRGYTIASSLVWLIKILWKARLMQVGSPPLISRQVKDLLGRPFGAELTLS